MLLLLIIDVTGTVLVAIVLKIIDRVFNISEEVASLVLPKDTTNIRDLFKAVKTTLNTFSLNLVNISKSFTGGTLFMVI